MYHGTNPTARQSQEWLADSLAELMLHLPYSQIAIKDICKKADLSRQTFYNLFDSKEEVLRFCLQREYEKCFERFDGQQSMTVAEVVGAFLSVLEGNRDLLGIMLDNGLDGIIADEIAKCISLFAGRFVREEKKDELLPYAEAMLSGALSRLLVYWFSQENPISVEQMTCLLEDFLKGRLYELD